MKLPALQEVLLEFGRLERVELDVEMLQQFLLLLSGFRPEEERRQRRLKVTVRGRVAVTETEMEVLREYFDIVLVYIA